jgi:hypothetical protein
VRFDRYEQAATEYQSILKSMLSVDDSPESKESSDAEISPEHRLLARKDSQDTIAVTSSSSGKKSSSSKHGLQPTSVVVSYLTNEVGGWWDLAERSD